MTRVKVCGLTRERDLETAVDAGADAVGVVTDVPVETPRAVTPDRAADLLAAAPPFATTVLVTMPSGSSDVADLVERVAPDAVQVHGGLAAADLATLRETVGARILYAVDADAVTDDGGDATADAGASTTTADRSTADRSGSTGGAETSTTDDAVDGSATAVDFGRPVLDRYDEVVDALVVDSASPEGGGGTGRTHNWERTRSATATLDSPLILAGGLTPANVATAVETVSPFAVDVASGVEVRGGEKDADAVRAFVERAKRAPNPVEP